MDLGAGAVDGWVTVGFAELPGPALCDFSPVPECGRVRWHLVETAT
jgi:hypothetical protein